MTTLLKINASLFSTQGQSSQLAERFVAARLAANPELKVINRDLAAQPVPHLDAARFQSFLVAAGVGERADFVVYLRGEEIGRAHV